MNKKSALIVDDSKSARLVLKRMLEVHGLDIATAESAEDALRYLNDHRPDVIFMDHLMPGMDGFEAVSAIKKNPDTATIPIMMYTSQKGEVYVGQARALGAVGVLPKEVNPVEVSKVLASLRVIGEHADRERQAAGAGEPRNGAGFPELERFDHDLRELIEDLFAQQRAVIRRDLLDSYAAIAQRVADEIRAPGRVEDATVTEVAPRAVSRRAQAIVAGLAVVTVALSWLLWQRDQGLRQAEQRNAELAAALETLEQTEAASVIPIERAADQPDLAAALAAVEWALNRSASYGFDEFPLGERRLAMLEDLTPRLIDMGFEGEVLVETHVGDFCLAAGADGFRMAAPEVNAADCDQLGYDPGEALDLGMRQSVAFANFVNITEEDTAGRIRYVVVSRGNSAPAMPYPPVASAVSAGAWNDVALANNRVEITLLQSR